jgi:hypothetical protein
MDVLVSASDAVCSSIGCTLLHPLEQTRTVAFKSYCSGATTHDIFSWYSSSTYFLARLGKIFILPFVAVN